MNEENMNEKTLRARISDMDMDETIDLKVNYETEFAWDDDENDLAYTVIRIDSFTISKEAILDILHNDETWPTTSWEGRVIQQKRYSKDEVEDVDEPAYGGFGNTDGISEMGELYVDREMLLSGSKRT